MTYGRGSLSKSFFVKRAPITQQDGADRIAQLEVTTGHEMKGKRVQAVGLVIGWPSLFWTRVS
jgi:hypothetical protein